MASRTLRILLVVTLGISNLMADVFNQESFKTHYRWTLILNKDDVSISKKDRQVILKIKSADNFDKIVQTLAKSQTDSSYIDKIDYKSEPQNNIFEVVIQLKDPSVELFSFYREPERKYILDYWINSDLISEKSAGFTKPLAPPPVFKKTDSKLSPIPAKLKTSSVLEVKEIRKTKEELKNPSFRDFRYGAAFFWDYPALLPTIEKDVNLESKTPDFLYPIKDRANLDDPREAHLQLSINFYKNEKFGLMNKSLTLFEKKYGATKDADVTEYLKVNALLKSNILKKDRSVQASAMNMISFLISKTNNYELKRGLYRYLIQYHLDRADHIKTLELSKAFFIEARSEFDHDMVILSSQIILYNLAQLKQSQKINEFLNDKKLMNMLPPQIGLAYLSYANLIDKKSQELIREFEKTEKSLVRPVHPSILFNVAESYFREANFEKAIKLFDEFSSEYSFMMSASHARLRIGLCYDLLNKKMDEIITIYRKTIDRSSVPEIRYEAKLRFVANKLIRNYQPNEKDQEVEVFLEQSPDESKTMSQDLKKLLWLVRLRLFISKQDYEKALSYLTSIPIDTFRPIEKRVFEADGAEIIFGVIKHLYEKEDYAKTVKVWEVYKNKYEEKVAKNPYLNFLAAESYLKLGLHKSYQRALSDLDESQEISREFPLWVERKNNLKLADYRLELDLIKSIESQNWSEARAILSKYPVSLGDSVKTIYFQGILDYHSAKYLEAGEQFEKAMIRPELKTELTPRQMADLLMSYVESVYHLKDVDRFKTIIKALALDIDKSTSASILNISERVHYLMLEMLATEEKMDIAGFENLTKTFKTRFQKSPYISRIEFLLGISFIKSDKINEGKSILDQLVSNTVTPGYIREMAKTELSALALKNRKL